MRGDTFVRSKTVASAPTTPTTASPKTAPRAPKSAPRAPHERPTRRLLGLPRESANQCPPLV
eukprot:362999-Pyramimonas_sp.AAC.1